MDVCKFFISFLSLVAPFLTFHQLKNLETGGSNPAPEKEKFSFLQPAPAPAAPAKALPSWLQSEQAAAADPKVCWGSSIHF